MRCNTDTETDGRVRTSDRFSDSWKGEGGRREGGRVKKERKTPPPTAFAMGCVAGKSTEGPRFPANWEELFPDAMFLHCLFLKLPEPCLTELIYVNVSRLVVC